MKYRMIKHGEQRCPYWALAKKDECGMVVDGLYIPMPQHVQTFCLSSCFANCQQYIKGSELILRREQANYKYFAVGERRKTPRYPERLNVRLAACDPHNKPAKTVSFHAKTLDVGLGGLKIEVLQDIPAEAIVGFELDAGEALPGFLGVGKVKWCSPRSDSGTYELGLSYSDDVSTTMAMKKYLGHSV